MKLLAGQNEPECVCRGNWRLILKHAQPLLGKNVRDGRTGHVWNLFGLVHGDDDYYYGVWNGHTLRLLSCVGSLASYDLEETTDPVSVEAEPDSRGDSGGDHTYALPPLPEAALRTVENEGGESVYPPYYTADQMLKYARETVALLVGKPSK